MTWRKLPACDPQLEPRVGNQRCESAPRLNRMPWLNRATGPAMPSTII